MIIADHQILTNQPVRIHEMALDVEAIVALIKQRPEIRTVEIADTIDCDPELVEPALGPLISIGAITVIPVTAPNGKPANGFVFTKPVDVDVTVKVPRLAEQSGLPAPSKVEAAIRYVKANGSASSTDLRRVMQLTTLQSPLSYLSGALKDGRLRKHGATYLIGNGQPQAPSETAVEEKAPRRNHQPAGRRGRTPLPEAPKAAPFRCAIWSDGAMELQRGGATIANLTMAELALVVKEAAARGVQP